MENTQTQELAVLNIKREFDTTREKLFEAFTQPDMMNQWFHAFPAGRSVTKADLRVGGTYSIDMIPDSEVDAENGSSCDSSHYLHHGEYLEVDPPNKLVFTWKKDGFVDYSVVTLTFDSIGDSKTLLTLTHQVPSDKVAAHRQGWTGCIGNLEKYISR